MLHDTIKPKTKTDNENISFRYGMMPYPLKSPVENGWLNMKKIQSSKHKQISDRKE